MVMVMVGRIRRIIAKWRESSRWLTDGLPSFLLLLVIIFVFMVGVAWLVNWVGTWEAGK
jgi:hypothetical protein